MDYRGKYSIFDARKIRTYPLSDRSNRVILSDILDPDQIRSIPFVVGDETERTIDEVAGAVLSARKNGKPVVLFAGAHLIKNGLGRLLIDWVRRGTITLVAGNGATAIHDFELAMIGETSEHVPQALENGQFGMATEMAFHNAAVSLGNRHKMGYGEALGKTICDASFRDKVSALAAGRREPVAFRHPEISVLAACYECGVPFTVHAGIGTDVTDQHPSFNGEAKGGVSGRDFHIFVGEVARMTDGGVVLNVGSAVTGPEVLLKAVSMASNAGKPPNGLITADFDLRVRRPLDKDESEEGYYYRDQKSVVNRIPAAFHGKGYYIQGNQKTTIPLLYQKMVMQAER
jgi:hypothetical protein